MLHSSPVVIDLFAGGGGLSLGAHLAGFRSILAVDNDPDLLATFSLNFPLSVPRIADLAEASPQFLLNTAQQRPKKIHGIIGGPPCQGFSYIGRRATDDPRNALFYHFFRLVSTVRPLFFLIENVPGILQPKYLPLIEASLNLLPAAYTVYGPLRLNAADFGAATSRDRIFFIGIDNRHCGPLSAQTFATDIQVSPETVRAAISDLSAPFPSLDDSRHSWGTYCIPSQSPSLGPYATAARQLPPQELSIPSIRNELKNGRVSGFQSTQHTKPIVRRFAKLPQGAIDPISKCRRLAWDRPCHTLRAGTGKDRGSYQAIRPIHPIEPRVITIREAARLQGFPDWFQFHHTKWHAFRQIGNSVSPILAKALLLSILRQLPPV